MRLATTLTYLTAPFRLLFALAVMPYAIWFLFIKREPDLTEQLECEKWVLVESEKAFIDATDA